MNWNQKIVIITGASSGIGRATRLLLHEMGAKVYNLDIATPEEGAGQFIRCDMRSRQSIRDAIQEIARLEGRIDMLFANAGIHLFATIEQTSDEELDQLVGINILGSFITLQAVLPFMKQQQKGSIVLMGSDQSFVGKASSSVYGMTKGAVAQLAKSTAIDYAPFNIRVNCICPGTINTPLLDKAVAHYAGISGQASEKIMSDLNTIQPAGRIGRPEEIAEAVAFLLSDESSFITGSLLSADGGYVCQ
jgi:NAD(P)-dependent dehydrogenase (short-subunit alcohol dehydrogenase family)